MAFWTLNNIFDYQRPSRVHDSALLMPQPEDMLAPFFPDIHGFPRGPAGYFLRPWRPQASARNLAGNAASTAGLGKEGRFEVNLDVQQFKPEELSVKVNGDGTVTVEGRHEEKRDEHGYVSRHFVRKYALPAGHDAGKVESKLSSDGVLTITAPRMAVAGEEASRKVAIAQSGGVCRAASENSSEEAEKKEENMVAEKTEDMKEEQEEEKKEEQKEELKEELEEKKKLEHTEEKEAEEGAEKKKGNEGANEEEKKADQKAEKRDDNEEAKEEKEEKKPEDKPEKKEDMKKDMEVKKEQKKEEKNKEIAGQRRTSSTKEMITKFEVEKQFDGFLPKPK